MRQNKGAGPWGLILALSLATEARADDGPPPLLNAPAEAPMTPPTVAPNRPSAAKKPTTNLLRPRNGSGLSGPSVRRMPITPPAVVAASPAPRPSPTPSADLPAPLAEAPPPLAGPAEMTDAIERAPLPRVEAPSIDSEGPLPLDPTPPGDGPAPLVLETSPLDRTEPLPDALPDGEKLKPIPRSNFDKDGNPAQPPKRRSGIFGRNTRDRNDLRPRPAESDSSIHVEPRSDPAADAALKRKIEAKVLDAVGDRARDVEVRVVDRNIVVKARVDRFWNRRPVRKTIENLPALSGYRTKVEIDD